MNREIKFRVWDKESKTWIGNYSSDWVGTGIGNVSGPDIQPWKCMSLKGEIMSNDNMGGFVDNNQENYIIQQFTGTKDKNGKEIYDGDIIKVARCHTKQTEISKGHIKCECVEDGEEVGDVYWFSCFCQWTVSFQHIRYDDNDALTDNPHRYEVVGNIFETKI